MLKVVDLVHRPYKLGERTCNCYKCQRYNREEKQAKRLNNFHSFDSRYILSSEIKPPITFPESKVVTDRSRSYRKYLKAKAEKKCIVCYKAEPKIGGVTCEPCLARRRKANAEKKLAKKDIGPMLTYDWDRTEKK